MNVRTFWTIAVLAVSAGSASAQVLPKPTLTLDGARRVIAAAMAEARAKQAPGGVIAVVDDGGNLVALERLDNTFAAGANISIGKARTAALFKRSTRVFEEIIKDGRTSMVALDDFTPLQGGVPIVIDGQVVGAIGVSGAASAQQDDEVAIAGATAFEGGAITGGPRAAVGYFPAAQVAASFARGAVLVGAGGDRNYMVHTSRRDKAGEAEVHLRDTDIIYITEGTTTFVTGGHLVDGKRAGAEEIRGTSIEGGPPDEGRDGCRSTGIASR